jgi:ATP-dependent DNA ligase
MEPYLYPSMPNRLNPSSRYFETLDKDTAWIAEVKKNGWRCLVVKDAGSVTLWTRHKTTINEPLDEIREALASLPDGTMLDGELIFTRRVKGIPDALYLFDALYLKGERLTSLPLSKRKGILTLIYRDYLVSPMIELAEMVRIGKRELYCRSIEGDVNEGIVMKHLGSPYPASDAKCMDNPHWLKVKRIEGHVKVEAR